MGGAVKGILNLDKAVYGAISNPAGTGRRAVNDAFKKPRVPGLAPDTSVEDAAAAGERERQAMSRRRGRASTILTGPLGDLNPAQLGRKVLTGS